MLFGLPWFAWIAIVAIVGGMYTGYKTEKLKMQSSITAKNEELDDLRKMVGSLKSRIENLEAIAAQSPDEIRGSGIGKIEIEDEIDAVEENQKAVKKMASKS